MAGRFAMTRQQAWLIVLLLIACGTLAGLRAVTASLGSAAQNTQEPVRALFEPARLTRSPFPSDAFTTSDAANNTLVRVSLPKPDCSTRPSDCEDIDVLNTLDGFNLQPRISIPFDGPIEVTSVSSQTLFLVKLGSVLDSRDAGSGRVGINQVVWDVDSRTLHVQSDAQLEQHTRYLLIVTNGIRSASGNPVEATENFRRLLAADTRPDAAAPTAAYERTLRSAVVAAGGTGLARDQIVSAAVFTTQSATSVLQRIRQALYTVPPPSADFALGPDGSRTVFRAGEVVGIDFNQQTGDGPPRFSATRLNVAALSFVPDAVGSLAFGRFTSADFLQHPGEFIPPTGTRSATMPVRGSHEIFFNLFLPAGTRPKAGWPVAVYAHGTGQNKNGTLAVVATMAKHGIAVVAINAFGNGFGPRSTLTVRQRSGDSVTFSAGGRGFDQNGDGMIDGTEGSHAAPPRVLQLNRDGLIQTVSDLMQLVRLIRHGIDVDGDRQPDLDGSRIYYFGFSQGGNNGIVLTALEPDIRAAVFNVPSAPLIENRRLQPSARSEGASANASTAPALIFNGRRPSLINSPGITHLEGLLAPSPYFNEHMPLRDGVALNVRLTDGSEHEIRSPVINRIPGAMDIQQWFDRAAWAAQAYNPVAYSVHLRRNPLPGVPVRPLLLQFAIGDQAAQNPNAARLLRAGGLADRATLFRNDLAIAEYPKMPRNPHLFMANGNLIAEGDPFVLAIMRGAQEQIAEFFASDGTRVLHPEPRRFFEVPIAQLQRLEELNYAR
jgi:dienelactone hydrolase